MQNGRKMETWLEARRFPLKLAAIPPPRSPVDAEAEQRSDHMEPRNFLRCSVLLIVKKLMDQRAAGFDFSTVSGQNGSARKIGAGVIRKKRRRNRKSRSICS